MTSPVDARGIYGIGIVLLTVALAITFRPAHAQVDNPPPVVWQQHDHDCGAANCAWALAYQGVGRAWAGRGQGVGRAWAGRCPV